MKVKYNVIAVVAADGHTLRKTYRPPCLKIDGEWKKSSPKRVRVMVCESIGESK